uniref:Dynein heavy chain n=1 Tax=Globisporangium ultimum (strain ATCC 200006 / CBS 805.95 / DAOM BR144) TaxID=431595 RepID=K3WBQ2_GLOUD
MDLYELVDAETFVESLKTSKLSELQEKASIIKERIQFLLFERESVYIGYALEPGLPSSRDGDNMEASPFRPPGEIGAGLFRLAPDVLTSTAKTIKWRSHINKLLRDAEASLVDERARIETIFLAKRTRFQSEIEEFDGEVKGFAKKGDLRHAATYVVQLAKMKDTLFSFRKTMEAIIEEETKLQWKTTDFGKLDDIAEEMEPYEQLWKTAREFREMSSRWLRGNLFELCASEGMQALHQMLTIIANVSKILHLNSAGAAITAEMLKKQLTDFRENARLVGAILNPSMKDRHLKEVSALLGLSLDPQDPLTLLKVLEGGALDHLSKILEISQNATQEKQIEGVLIEIDIEWRELQFLFKAAKKPNYGSSNLPVSVELQKQRNAPDHPSLETSTLLQRESVEDVTQLVEEHQVRLHSLLCMQHAIPFFQEISSWLHFTRNIRRLLDALIAVERLWKAINPLFSARIVDIDSKETKLFGTADQLYKGVVMRIQRQPLYREVIPRVTQKSDPALSSIPQSMLADLNTCLSLLEEAKDTLRVGLDGKRSHFPRFYFLSDLELVSALSCRSASGDLLLEASELWKYLSPCFPGIHRVQVNASREITSLVSSVGEQFTLGTPIATANASVIAWLGKMETSMTTILQACVRAAISDLGRKEFRKWCLLWPEQILLVTIQYTWTMESEQANKKNSLREAHSTWEAITGNLRDKHVSVGKEMKAAEYPHLRMSLSNVLLLLSHLRDVSSRVCQDLLQQAVALSRPASTEGQIPFESLPWLTQPRYYYEENALVVKFMTAAPLAYGFEYLGNKSPPFYLTPLTLRCFHAIAQTAGVLSKGTCLEGTAGVGKTTLCNAISQSCGRLFVLYDCANTLSFEFMLQFIKGAASCSAWLAFESFQLLNPAQVSIVGHLCAHVMDTLTAKNGHCTLLGSKIRLKKGCHFVALCPGPSTQSSLQAMPSEARFFFKRVVLHAPDIKVITESLLHEGKFVNTAALAKLVCVVLNAFEREFSLLCSDPKSHASFLNLRFVKRIVRRAAELSLKEKPPRHDANVAFTQHLAAQSVTNQPSGPLEALDVEKLEHKVVCIALREELTATTPAANMDLIEFLLRDFAANSLTREIRITKSFLLTPPQASVGLVPSTLPGEQIESKSQLEDVIEDIVRTKESVWMAFGPGFSQKIIQLLQHMRANRAVVISGGIQSGKTALYKALARSISALCLDQTNDLARNILRGSAPKTYSNELIASTRCVVLAPRAVTVDKLFGTSAEHFANTLLAHIIRESKSFHEGGCKTNTWLILDGDFDSSWSEKLVCLVEELHGDVASRRKGLLLSSGKCMLLPRCMRLVMETTTLANASPSFLTRVGVVNVGQAIQHEWRGFYRAWKKAHELELDALADEIWGVVDVLVEETVDACFEFVESNFQRGFSQLRVARFKSLLALFHSSIRQSWPKLRSMVSGKQRKTAFHCFYLQALVWGIGNTCDAHERRTFHEFLRHLIIHGPFNAQSSLKRVLILFFPSARKAVA